MNEALISIKPKYVRRMLDGEKSVEIRNRTVNLTPESRLWIYSTLPKGCIEAVAEVGSVEIGTPPAIWHKYGDSLGISETKYRLYVNGASSVSAIRIRRVSQLPSALSLSMLRMRVPGFHPPQFLKYMADSDPLFLGIVRLLCASTNPEYIQEIGLTKKCSGLANAIR